MISTQQAIETFENLPGEVKKAKNIYFEVFCLLFWVISEVSYFGVIFLYPISGDGIVVAILYTR